LYTLAVVASTVVELTPQTMDAPCECGLGGYILQKLVCKLIAASASPSIFKVFRPIETEIDMVPIKLHIRKANEIAQSVEVFSWKRYPPSQFVQSNSIAHGPCYSDKPWPFAGVGGAGTSFRDHFIADGTKEITKYHVMVM
jgi:hypothetical protein